MTINLLPEFIRENYEVHEWKHACAILKGDFPEEWDDICSVLHDFRLYKSHILAPGGGKSKISQSIDSAFQERGWKEKNFSTKIIVDENEIESPTHKVDCVKNKIAVEIEWSNKDPFFDRDLNNFRLLFELRAISVGIIITKSDLLRKTMEELGIWRKYGRSTTWMGKLLPRIEGGGGGGCPILVFGITEALFVED
ncbi:MAG: restriction endonuclease [candidate division Zixibacteria bacterium]|nr:restriction endonuclease [candidate division Zixibacteria bacterium]